MDNIDELYAEIAEVEKARRTISPRARRDQARMTRKFSGGKLTAPSTALDRRISRRKPGHIVRNGSMLLRKSADVDVIDAFDDEVELAKARGLIPRGGSAKLARVFQKRVNDGNFRNKRGKSYMSGEAIASTRKKGGVTGMGYTPGKGYKSLRRTTRRGAYKT